MKKRRPGQPGRKQKSGVTLSSDGVKARRQKMKRESESNDEQNLFSVWPEAPEYLEGYARDAWNKWKPSFDELRITEADSPQIEAYCLACETMRETTVFMRRKGKTYKTDSGYIRPRPEVQMQMKAAAELRQLAMALGFNPLARSRLPEADLGDGSGQLELDLSRLMGGK